MLLMILIPTVWFATAAFFVIVCSMAGRADAADAYVAAEREQRPMPTIRLAPTPRARWHQAPRAAGSRATVAMSIRGASAARGRGGRCVTGS